MLCSGPKEGDLGPIWISVGGGGLGSRGEEGGILVERVGSEKGTVVSGEIGVSIMEGKAVIMFDFCVF